MSDADPMDSRLDWQDCRVYILSALITEEQAQRVLPPEVTAQSLIPGAAEFLLDAIKCGAVWIDNGTLLEDVSLLTFSVTATVRDAYTFSGRGFTFFTVAAWTDDPQLADLLASNGLNVSLATMEYDTSLLPSFAISQGGSPFMQWNSAMDYTPIANDVSSTIRMVYQDEEGFRWMDSLVHREKDNAALFEEGIMDYDGGLLATAFESESGSYPFRNMEVFATLNSTFQYAPDHPDAP